MTILQTYCEPCGRWMMHEDVPTHLGDYHGAGAIIVRPASKDELRGALNSAMFELKIMGESYRDLTNDKDGNWQRRVEGFVAGARRLLRAIKAVDV